MGEIITDKEHRRIQIVIIGCVTVQLHLAFAYAIYEKEGLCTLWHSVVSDGVENEVTFVNHRLDGLARDSDAVDDQLGFNVFAFEFQRLGAG